MLPLCRAGGQYSGNIRFIEKPGVQDEGGRHVAKHNSDPRVAYPEVKVQIRHLVRVVGIGAPFYPVRDKYSEKIRFIEEPEVHVKVVALWLNVALSSGLPIPKLKFRYET